MMPGMYWDYANKVVWQQSTSFNREGYKFRFCFINEELK